MDLNTLYNNDLEKSEYYFKQILVFDSRNQYALINLGILYTFYHKNFNIAEDYFLRAYEINYRNIDVLNSLGYLYQEHDVYKSKKYLLMALFLDNKHPDTLNNLGNLYMEKFKEYTIAEKYYLKLLELNPKSFTAKYNLKILYSKIRDLIRD